MLGTTYTNVAAVGCSEESYGHFKPVLDHTYEDEHGVRDHVERTREHIVSHIRAGPCPRPMGGTIASEKPLVCSAPSRTSYACATVLFPCKETQEGAQEGGGDKEHVYHARCRG